MLVRPLEESDLAAADHVMRLAFGTFLGLEEPSSFMGDGGYVHTRWATDPSAAFALEVDGRIMGSNFATNWGSVGFFGPLSVHPDLWSQGLPGRLMEPVLARFTDWNIRHAGLFTFPQSPKHIALYHKFGFRPRFLTPILAKPVQASTTKSSWSPYSAGSETDRRKCAEACRDVTDAIYPGLDLTLEVRAICTQKLGDTVLLWEGPTLVGFAACHCGAGTEAGTGTCFVKFAAVRPGPEACVQFDRLLAACEEYAATQSASRLVGGVNTGRTEAYQRMLTRGFRTDFIGVAMHRHNEEGYNRPGVYVIDDWR